MDKEFEGKIKRSFQDLREDISNIKKEISNVSNKIELNTLKRKKQEKIYTSKPYVNQEMLDAVKEVLESGIFSMGEEVKEFEKKFSEFTGAKYAIAVSNGTVAIEIVLKSLGLKKGDEVIVPSYTTMPSIEPIINLEAVPVFVDIDEKTYTIDPEKVEKAVTKKTKVIIPVHIYGQAADVEKLNNVCKKNKIYLIEDCAQAHNAKYKGKHVGTFGIAGCFSFYPTKNITVCGEGGMIITNSDEINKKARRLINHGEDGRYNHVIVGTNYRLGEIQCAIGIKQLEMLEDFTRRRREIAKLYNELLKDSKIILPYESDYGEHCFHLYVIRLNKEKRDKIIEELKKDNIFLGIHYPKPCHMQSVVKNLYKKKYKLPITEKVTKEIISLPIYYGLKDEEVEMICNKIKELL